MACVFVNERKGQVHLLGLASADAMEQTHVYELHAPGKYDVSVIDNVLLMHNQRDKVTFVCITIYYRNDTLPSCRGYHTGDINV
jgi:hypothetical protein